MFVSFVFAIYFLIRINIHHLWTEIQSFMLWGSPCCQRLTTTRSISIINYIMSPLYQRFTYPRSDAGKAEAFQILMRIFETKRDTQFSPTFLACFYNGLELGLVRNAYLMGIILTCTKGIFQLVLSVSSSPFRNLLT